MESFIVNQSENVQKATQGQLKVHNRQLLLRAIYSGEINNRAALAQLTNLTKGTVSLLIAELMDEGYLIESGLGQLQEGPGKPPRLLRFVPTARQVIGLSINGERIEGVLANLDGQVAVYHSHPVGNRKGAEVVELLEKVINGLVIQQSAQLLSIGIGSEGILDTQNGIVINLPSLDWCELPLGSLLNNKYGVPVYLANSTQLVAVGEYVFGKAIRSNSIAVVSVKDSVGVGLLLNRASYENGNDIGEFRLSNKPLEKVLSWQHVKDRVQELRRVQPATLLPEIGLTYLHLHYAAAQGNTVALHIYDELAETLAMIFSWIIMLHRPDYLSLVGQIADLGVLLLDKISIKMQEHISRKMISSTTLLLDSSPDLIPIGAVAHVLHLELGIV